MMACSMIITTAQYTVRAADASCVPAPARVRGEGVKRAHTFLGASPRARPMPMGELLLLLLLLLAGRGGPAALCLCIIFG